ncbi:MAG: bifunctional riboflavin kinase/FAD synthetase [Kineosporiaceae bacterium]|nr:bifunctional riboflavin kinase/FAD synthetase [Kineosporiaceae bacterium]
MTAVSWAVRAGDAVLGACGWQSRGVQRWNELSEAAAALKASGSATVVTIGNFDGVHRGHQAVLGQIVAEAHRRQALAVAITFDPHPLAVLYPERAPATLTGLDHKLELLAATGLDAVLVLTFTRELAGWSPEHFVQAALVDALHVRAVVVGRDMRFGHKNSGDVTTLRTSGKQLGFEVLLLDDLGFGADATGEGATARADAESTGEDADGVRRWSSTWVRELLADGDVTRAAEVLGRPHRVSGEVVHGDHRGRLLGYPTANLSQDAVGLVPADGVYAGWLVLLDADGAPRLPAAISVGTNPTFDGHQRRVEAYVLDRDDLDLYGQQVGVEFVRLLRPTLRFDGVEALIVQMRSDVEECRQTLGVADPGRV